MRLFILFFLIAFFPSASKAEKADSLTDLFDAVCISSQLQEQAIKNSTVAYAKHFDLKMIDAPMETLSVLNPFAKYGWVLGGHSSYVVNYAVKPVEHWTSQSCNVGSPEGNLTDIQEFIETRFKAKKITDTYQGTNRIIIYKPTWVGFSDEIFIGIQVKDENVTDDRFINLSLYEGGNK